MSPFGSALGKSAGMRKVRPRRRTEDERGAGCGDPTTIRRFFMSSDRVYVILSLLAAIAACAAGPSPADNYWRSASGSRADFASDHQSCGAAATRRVPTPRADQVAGGAVAPENRLDRPPRPWVSAEADRAYMDCMAERGWTLARR